MKNQKPKVFKKEIRNREIRMARQSSASEAIGRLEKGMDVFILTFGQFSLIEALGVILDQTGSADVDFATWTANDAHLERAGGLMEAANIRRLRMVVDHSFEGRQPGSCYHMRKLFGDECIRSVRTHAKFMVVRSEGWNVVVRTSMNLNENPRLENIEISESKAFADFFVEVVDGIFAEVDEGERRSRMLELPGLPDNYPFKEVEGRQIRRETVNEPKVTHTIKKL